MRQWWRQFREIGVPRCEEHDCRRLIWPWQAWVSQIEQWPEHHGCYHRHLVGMWLWTREQGERVDWYETCRYCKRPTASIALLVPEPVI